MRSGEGEGSFHDGVLSPAPRECRSIKAPGSGSTSSVSLATPGGCQSQSIEAPDSKSTSPFVMSTPSSRPMNHSKLSREISPSPCHSATQEQPNVTYLNYFLALISKDSLLSARQLISIYLLCYNKGVNSAFEGGDAQHLRELTSHADLANWTLYLEQELLKLKSAVHQYKKNKDPVRHLMFQPNSSPKLSSPPDSGIYSPATPDTAKRRLKNQSFSEDVQNLFDSIPELASVIQLEKSENNANEVQIKLNRVFLTGIAYGLKYSPHLSADKFASAPACKNILQEARLAVNPPAISLVRNWCASGTDLSVGMLEMPEQIRATLRSELLRKIDNLLKIDGKVECFDVMYTGADCTHTDQVREDALLNITYKRAQTSIANVTDSTPLQAYSKKSRVDAHDQLSEAYRENLEVNNKACIKAALAAKNVSFLSALGVNIEQLNSEEIISKDNIAEFFEALFFYERNLRIKLTEDLSLGDREIFETQLTKALNFRKTLFSYAAETLNIEAESILNLPVNVRNTEETIQTYMTCLRKELRTWKQEQITLQETLQCTAFGLFSYFNHKCRDMWLDSTQEKYRHRVSAMKETVLPEFTKAIERGSIAGAKKALGQFSEKDVVKVSTGCHNHSKARKHVKVCIDNLIRDNQSPVMTGTMSVNTLARAKALTNFELGTRRLIRRNYALRQILAPLFLYLKELEQTTYRKRRGLARRKLAWVEGQLARFHEENYANYTCYKEPTRKFIGTLLQANILKQRSDCFHWFCGVSGTIKVLKKIQNGVVADGALKDSITAADDFFRGISPVRMGG